MVVTIIELLQRSRRRRTEIGSGRKSSYLELSGIRPWHGSVDWCREVDGKSSSSPTWSPLGDLTPGKLSHQADSVLAGVLHGALATSASR